MQSVFQKFGGIRPMATKLGDVPPSTVKSWHKNRVIPAWRHDAILAAAERHRVRIKRDELENVRPDEPEAANDEQPQGAAA